VADAQSSDIKVYTPNILQQRDNFYTDGQNLHFGLLNIKGVGKSVLIKLKKAIANLPKRLDELSWLEFLVYISQNIDSKSMKALIMSGALDYLKLPRTKMWYEFEKFSLINPREIDWIQKNVIHKSLIDAIRSCATLKKNGGIVANVNRLAIILQVVKMLEEPSYELKDKPIKIIEAEKNLLGVALTYNISDSIDYDDINCTCDEFNNGKTLKNFIIGVEIAAVRPYNIKKGKQAGKNMYYLDITDGSANIEKCVVFPGEFEEYGSLITPGNKVILFGTRDNKFGGFNVNKVKQA
jgi:DNA polymerase III alpha subunit